MIDFILSKHGYPVHYYPPNADIYKSQTIVLWLVVFEMIIKPHEFLEISTKIAITSGTCEIKMFSNTEPLGCETAFGTDKAIFRTDP